jgi:hypothetical protein
MPVLAGLAMAWAVPMLGFSWAGPATASGGHELLFPAAGLAMHWSEHGLG